MLQPDFTSLTWGDLIGWAGKQNVITGRRQQQAGSVRDLSVTENAGILAWVSGEEMYATYVEISGNDLSCRCSCNQIDQPCPHGIAVIIEYIANLKKKRQVRQVPENDQRFYLL